MKNLLAAIVCFALMSVAVADLIKISTTDDATLYAAQLIEKYELTRNRTECLAFEIEHERASFFMLRVRENHKAGCGGDPIFAPTLFFMKIRKDGRATTDAYDGDKFIAVSEAAKKIAARRASEKRK